MTVRFVVCTYNIWSNNRWPARKAALQSFIELHRPDVLSLQELHPATRQVLDEILSATHVRIDDVFEGWVRESNIFWNSELFEMVEYGAEEIGQLEPHRRLFWVRLRFLQPGPQTQQTLVVATAHYSWPGNAQEVATGINQRLEQARRTIEVVNRIVAPTEPLLFMGDLNDSLHPIDILRQGGLNDCFAELNQPQPLTYPTLPTATEWRPFAIDWIFKRGPLRVMCASVVDFFKDDLAPSDHKPVMATYGWP